MIATVHAAEKQREIAEALVDAFDALEPLRLAPLPPDLIGPDFEYGRRGTIGLYEWPAPEAPPPPPPEHLVSDVRNARAHLNAMGVAGVALGRRRQLEHRYPDRFGPLDRSPPEPRTRWF